MELVLHLDVLTGRRRLADFCSGALHKNKTMHGVSLKQTFVKLARE